jgi:hypothetical protein
MPDKVFFEKMKVTAAQLIDDVEMDKAGLTKLREETMKNKENSSEGSGFKAMYELMIETIDKKLASL